MALDLFVVVKGKELDEGFEEAALDDRCFVGWVDGDVSDTSGGG